MAERTPDPWEEVLGDPRKMQMLIEERRRENERLRKALDEYNRFRANAAKINSRFD